MRHTMKELRFNGPGRWARLRKFDPNGDCGVVDADSGLVFTRVPITRRRLRAGQYSVDSIGTYRFSTRNKGASLVITYLVKP